MSRVKNLRYDIEFIEDQLAELEQEGIYGGTHYDALVAELADADGELQDHLRYGVEG